VNQCLARTIGDAGKAALERALGMDQPGRLPGGGEPLGQTRDLLVDQLAAQAAGD